MPRRSRDWKRSYVGASACQFVIPGAHLSGSKAQSS